jgi:NAD(P)-dependent dehydrogenase (short-subunit alcohol dehydrogenase family)
MSRTCVVTGAASGIGRATVDLLTAQGHRVIGVDVHRAEVVADLATPDGRRSLVDQVAALTGGRIDAVIANAGLMAPTARTVAVNHFGAVATLEGLRPLLVGSDAPRAVITLSGALLMPPDEPLLVALLAGDEPRALDRARALEDVPDLSNPIYRTTKRALARWLRREAPGAGWAGRGIPLNAVAPGFVDTPLVADVLAAGGVGEVAARMMPLGGVAGAADLAAPLAWLASAENTATCGQVLFVDGGFEARSRGEDPWAQRPAAGAEALGAALTGLDGGAGATGTTGTVGGAA